MKKQPKLKNKEIASFFRQISMLIQAGISPEESIRILAGDTNNANGSRILESILTPLTEGDRFYVALEKAECFPDYVVHMVELGETSGNLDTVTTSLADYYETQAEINENLRGAITYPLIMVAMMLVVMIALVTQVLPIFQQVFEQLGAEMSGLSRSLLLLGEALNSYAVAILIVFAVLVLIVLILSRIQKGKELLGNLVRIFPTFRSFQKNVAASRFAGGMALSLRSGLDTYASLDLVEKIIEEPQTHQKIQACRNSLNEGKDFAQAISDAKLFTSLYTQMVSVGYRTGTIDTVMRRIEKSYNKEVQQKMQTILGIIEPTLVIILSVVVGLILLSVILPLIGIMTSIG